MRIFRTIILLSGITVFMPSPPEDVQTSQPGNTVLPGLISTAAQAVSDVAGFCARQPSVCETAGYLAGKVEAKAKYSVRLLYEWANESSSDPAAPLPVEQAKSDPISTGSTTAVAAAAGDEGQSTLQLEDLIPEWRGPVKSKKS